MKPRIGSRTERVDFVVQTLNNIHDVRYDRSRVSLSEIICIAVPFERFRNQLIIIGDTDVIAFNISRWDTTTGYYVLNCNSKSLVHKQLK